MEGFDRQRQRARRQPHRPGAQHRRGYDRGGAGRLVEEDHGRREGRDPRAQEHHQRHGRPAQFVRLRGDARCARGRLGRKARRPGPGRRRRRHLGRPDQQCERACGELDGPGPQHRRSDDRGGLGRLVQEDHRRREGRNSRAQEHRQHDGRPAQLVRVGSDARGARGRHRGQARRPGQRRAASPARGRI